MAIVHVVSVSGGKDSLATLLLCLARFPRSRIDPIFCDTDNEHEAVYEYLTQLEKWLGIKIRRLKADFTEEIKRKRDYIARDTRNTRVYEKVPKTDKHGAVIYKRRSDGTPELDLIWTRSGWDVVGIPKLKKAHGKKARWTNKAKRRALAVLFPTGNAFLDLCLMKGRFPSRKAQFCTERLKRDLAVEYQLDLMEAGHTVISWQGIRRDESENRRLAAKIERLAPQMFIYRPIVEWTASDVFDYCASRCIEPNPLYRQGMSRVGCMPCINVQKGELRTIAVRFPGHIAKISQWETAVGNASKRGFATFLTDKGKKDSDRRKIFGELNIHARVEWSRTQRGGKQLDLLAGLEESEGCSSSYGLCDRS